MLFIIDYLQVDRKLWYITVHVQYRYELCTCTGYSKFVKCNSHKILWIIHYVQILGVKQLPPTNQLAPSQSGKTPEEQRQKHPKEKQEQPQRYPPHQQHPPSRRDPVMDLAGWCRSFGKPEPKYDFVGQVSTREYWKVYLNVNVP